MKRNLGSIDKILRIGFAAIVAILWATQVITGMVALVLGIAGAVLLATAIINFCPIYSIFGIRTCKVNPPKQHT